MSCKLVLEDFQDAILLSDNLLNGSLCVQGRCGVGLTPGKESCDCRKQVGQWASGLLKTLSQGWTHFNKDVDCGRQREDVENLDVVVLPLRPPVSKVQELKRKECTVGREISSGGWVTCKTFTHVVSCNWRKQESRHVH